jgi:hypothetical protein
MRIALAEGQSRLRGVNEPMRLMDVPLLNRSANLHVTLATISPQIAIDAPVLPVFSRVADYQL